MADNSRILITGASGFIGRALLAQFADRTVVGTQFNSREAVPGPALVTIDLRDAHRVAELVQRIEPTIVFHFAALTSPGRNDLDPVLAGASHRTVTENVLRVLPRDAQVVFLSTDKVFDGADPCPDESTTPVPCCLYGELKLECEDMIRRDAIQHHILRLPIVHADGAMASGSFVDRAIENLAAGRRVQAFANVSRCYVKLHELVSLLVALVGNTDYGTYHIGSPMSSYYDRIRAVCAEVNVEWRDRLAASEGAVRPLVQNLDTAKFKRTFGRTFS